VSNASLEDRGAVYAFVFIHALSLIFVFNLITQCEVFFLFSFFYLGFNKQVFYFINTERKIKNGMFAVWTDFAFSFD